MRRSLFILLLPCCLAAAAPPAWSPPTGSEGLCLDLDTGDDAPANEPVIGLPAGSPAEIYRSGMLSNMMQRCTNDLITHRIHPRLFEEMTPETAVALIEAEPVPDEKERRRIIGGKDTAYIFKTAAGSIGLIKFEQDEKNQTRITTRHIDPKTARIILDQLPRPDFSSPQSLARTFARGLAVHNLPLLAQCFLVHDSNKAEVGRANLLAAHWAACFRLRRALEALYQQPPAVAAALPSLPDWDLATLTADAFTPADNRLPSFNLESPPTIIEAQGAFHLQLPDAPDPDLLRAQTKAAENLALTCEAEVDAKKRHPTLQAALKSFTQDVEYQRQMGLRQNREIP